MAQQNNRPAISTVVVDRTQLFTSAPGNPQERSSLSFEFMNSNSGLSGYNPRIVVWTRVPNDNTPISLALNAHSFELFLQLLEQAIQAQPGWTSDRLTAESRNKDKETGEQLPGYSTQAYVVVGKNKDGCVWISVISGDESRPVIVFKFTTGMWHHLQNRDGTKVSEAQESELAAKATLRILREANIRYLPLLDDAERQKRSDARGQLPGARPRQQRGGQQQEQRQQPKAQDTSFDDIAF